VHLGVSLHIGLNIGTSAGRRPAVRAPLIV